MYFPSFNSKSLATGRSFDLLIPEGRSEYFKFKLGGKIDAVKKYLQKDKFVGFLLSKKMSGKGTYSKMIEEILGPDLFCSFSVGDIIRGVHQKIDNPEYIRQLGDYLTKNGKINITDAVYQIKSRSMDKITISAELIVLLLKKEILDRGKNAIFIDGFPRDVQQIDHARSFKHQINYDNGVDFFVIIEAPNALIDARMRGRRVCPLCGLSKNTYFNPSKYIKYDNSTQEFVFICDNQQCVGCGSELLVQKEGDSQGISLISKRIKQDQELIDEIDNMIDVVKVPIISSIPADEIKIYLEDYEIQNQYSYSFEDSEVLIKSEQWEYPDDNGKMSSTMLAAVYAVNLFDQIYKLID